MHLIIPALRLLFVAAWWATALLESPGAPAEKPAAASEPAEAAFEALSPTAMVAAPGGEALYIACATAPQVLVFDTSRRQVSRRFTLPAPPSGLALFGEGRRLVVTCAAPVSPVWVIDTASGQVIRTLEARHTAMSPVVSRDEKTLFVCNRFNDEVSLFDISQGRELGRIPTVREPVAAALALNDRFLLVANHLPRGPSDAPYVAATVSVIEVASRKTVKELRLPNGTINLREIRVSPDRRYAGVVHTIGRFHVPVTQLHRGWVNTSALTLIDLITFEVLNTVLLDDVNRGAANPWALAWTADGRWLCLTHAGTHELSVIDFPALIEKLRALPAVAPKPGFRLDADAGSHCQADVPNDLSFLGNLRRRMKLAGKGPRSVAIANGQAFVAGYFSDSLDVVNLLVPRLAAETIPLGPEPKLTLRRRGEMAFNDATVCFQGWQSCATCHDDDARVDGLNWDLLNDGIGNPKDTKSLLLSHLTPPVMSLGVRATAAVAVRNGILNSLGTNLPEDVPAAIDEWLKSLKPAPSPHLAAGQLSAAASQGKVLFESAVTGCASCHSSALFTDLHSYDVGTVSAFDRQDRSFDTPTLVELWRTGPYLHDGSAATLREVLTTRNLKDEHGKTSHLTPRELDDLVEYLLSL